MKAGARREEIEAARARVAVVDAQIAASEKAIADATVRAPPAGTITSKLVNVGEIVAPRAPLAVMTDLDHAWGEVFVDEPLVPRLALGQPATLHTDAGGAGLPGKVTFISPKAEFTPRNVQTAEERSRLVYRIKVTADNSKGMLEARHAGRGGTATAMTATLSLDRVTKRYGALTAVSDVSFDVQPGEMFGLIGPDGAGKTTTIRLLCGLLHADGGSVRVLGHDPVREHAAVTRSVGYLSQRFSLYGDLSIDENIAFFAEIHDLSSYEERRRRLLELTNLLPFRARLADRLSGGMKQKLALACTLMHEPRVILLDEPTTGVDPVSRREFWKLLAEFLEQGITILVSTPYLDEAERCHRVALLHEGRLLSLDTPDRLRRSLPGQMVEAIVEDQPRAVAMLSAHAGGGRRARLRRADAREAGAVGHRGRRGAGACGADKRRLRRRTARVSCRPRSRMCSSLNCLEFESMRDLTLLCLLLLVAIAPAAAQDPLPARADA